MDKRRPADTGADPASRRAADPASRRAADPASRRAADPASRRAADPASRRAADPGSRPAASASTPPVGGSRYGSDVLTGDWRAAHAAPRGRTRDTPAELGLVVEDVESGWCGAVVRVEKAGGVRVVHLEDRRGRTRGFPLGPGFLLDGAPVRLVPPAAVPSHDALTLPGGNAPHRRPGGAPPARTASGSRAVHGLRARVARGSRIFVEGRHDAELVEQVWGDDLRIEGVVVEMLDGVDDLAAAIAEFAPGPDRRLGVLVDHLVPGSKESRLVHQARSQGAWAAYVRIVGHPYVDVWQSVRPERLGLAAWPVIDRSAPWKQGIAAALGWPHQTQTDIAMAWRRILGSVRTYADLEPELLARVEELIDFVTSQD